MVIAALAGAVQEFPVGVDELDAVLLELRVEVLVVAVCEQVDGLHVGQGLADQAVGFVGVGGEVEAVISTLERVKAGKHGLCCGYCSRMALV